jgi:hypothetical protein
MGFPAIKVLPMRTLQVLPMECYPTMPLEDFIKALRELAPLQHRLEGLTDQHLVLTDATRAHIRMNAQQWMRGHLHHSHPLKDVLVSKDLYDHSCLKIELQLNPEFIALIRDLEAVHPGFNLMEGFVPPSLVTHAMIDGIIDDVLEIKSVVKTKPVQGWNDNPFED